jgi:hypothetical protein
MLAEVAMSGAMLLIAMTLTMKVLGWVGMERRAWDHRQWAVQEAANLMERLTSRPYASVTSDSVASVTLSPQAKALLPAAELKGELGENHSADGIGSKRIALQLRWRNRFGEWDAPVRLVAWIHDRRPR